MGGRLRFLAQISTLPLLVVAAGTIALAQSQVVEVKVHSPALEHNQLGDPVDQNVAVYLPAAYRVEPHALEVYEGNHGNRVRERVETHVLPWRSKQLKH